MAGGTDSLLMGPPVIIRGFWPCKGLYIGGLPDHELHGFSAWEAIWCLSSGEGRRSRNGSIWLLCRAREQGEAVLFMQLFPEGTSAVVGHHGCSPGRPLKFQSSAEGFSVHPVPQSTWGPPFVESCFDLRLPANCGATGEKTEDSLFRPTQVGSAGALRGLCWPTSGLETRK